MVPQVTDAMSISDQADSFFPKTVFYGGKTVKLLPGSQCLKKYGFNPGTLLRNEEEILFVIGIGKQGELWVKAPLSARSYPLENIRSQEDLRLKGIEVINKKRKRDAANIDDSQDLVNRVHKLFKTQTDCDVFFEVEGQMLGGHTAILREGSSYFYKLLDDNFKEGKSKVVQLKECTKEKFDILMNYLYSGLVNIDEENILFIAELADYFAVEQLSQHCETYLMRFLTPRTILSYLSIIAEQNHHLAPMITQAFYQNIEEISWQDTQTLEQLKEQVLFYIIQHCPPELKEKLNHFILFWLLQRNDQIVPRAQFLDQIFLLCNGDDHLLHQYIDKLHKKMEQNPSMLNSFEALAHTSQSIKIKLAYAKILSNLNRPLLAKVYFESVLDLEPQNSFASNGYEDTLYQLRLLDPVEH